GDDRIGCHDLGECRGECCALHHSVKHACRKSSGLKGRSYLFVLIDGEKNALHRISPSDLRHGGTVACVPPVSVFGNSVFPNGPPWVRARGRLPLPHPRRTARARPRLGYFSSSYTKPGGCPLYALWVCPPPALPTLGAPIAFAPTFTLICAARGS